jgi:hypothetical protein
MCAISVNVINFLVRKFSGHVEPSQSVGGMSPPIDPDPPITMDIPPRDLPYVNTRAGLNPSSEPS